MAFPVQVVGDAEAFSWRTVDLSAVSRDRLDSELDAIFDAERREAFAASAGPLVHVVGITLAPAQHALLIACSSLCADAASVQILANAVVRRCAPDASGEIGEPLQYVDFSEWENERLDSVDRSAAPETLRQLVSSEAAVAAPGIFAPERISRPLPPELARRLEALADSYRSSVSTVLLACWQLLLWRLGETPVVWVLDAAREGEMSDAVGLFERYLPTAVELDDDLPLAELVGRIARQAEQAREYTDAVLGAEPAAIPQRFGFEHRSRAASTGMSGLRASMRSAYSCSQRCALRLAWADVSDFELHYDSTRYTPGDVERLAERYLLLLDRIADDPDGCLAAFDVTVPEERQRILSDFNRTQLSYDATRTVVQLVEDQARRTPDAVAVWCDHRELTYGDLNSRANRWAHALRARGVGPGVLVGLCVERSVEAFVALLAVWKAGGAYVPLDPTYPRERLTFILTDARPAVLLTLSTLADSLPPCGMPVLYLDSMDSEADAPAGVPPSDDGPIDRLAYVMYTSGTTGEPKGVMVTHANLSHYVHALQSSLGIAADDRYLHTASLAFSSSVRQALLPLCGGATLIVATRDEVRTPLRLFALIRQMRVTVIDIVPTYWRTCVQILSGLEASAREAMLENKLRLILSASEPLTRGSPAIVDTRPGAAHGARQHVRPDRDGGHRHGSSHRPGERGGAGRCAGRPADCQHGDLHLEFASSTRTGRRRRRNSRRGARRGPRLPQSSGAACAEVRSAIRSARRPARRVLYKTGRSGPISSPTARSNWSAESMPRSRFEGFVSIRRRSRAASGRMPRCSMRWWSVNRTATVHGSPRSSCNGKGNAPRPARSCVSCGQSCRSTPYPKRSCFSTRFR